jgi:hypothetical protein
MVETYRNHLIVAAGVLDEFTRRYAPIAWIMWTDDRGKRESHVFEQSLRRFCVQDEAMNFSLSEARTFVDERLDRQASGSPS